MKASTIHAATSHAKAKADLFDDGNLDNENLRVRCLQRAKRCRALLSEINWILNNYQQKPQVTWADSGNLANIEHSLKTIAEDYKQ